MRLTRSYFRALTIHKSQGQSLDAVGVRLNATFEKGQYVTRSPLSAAFATCSPSCGLAELTSLFLGVGNRKE